MRTMRWSLAGLFACGLPVACADPCIDDGLGQAGEGNCPQASAGQTEGQTDSNTDTVTATMGSATMGSNTDAMTDSQSATETVGETVGETLDGTSTDTIGDTDTVGDTDTMGSTDTAGGTLWCVDADEDGYGDPDMCTQSDEMPPGTVGNDDDCDDTNTNTFPGAAPNDDPRACMQDDDGDDWGDDGSGGNLPPGVDPGTDCLDEDANVRPGAAEQEPDLCAEDTDDDGWGDGVPPPGADPGSDCDDDDPNIFPGAAEQEPELCAEDGDNDGWGDSDPPPGVDPGTDCDDGNVFAFPGAAPNDDPAACMQDEDDDDWGDDGSGPGGLPPGVQPGTDCDDTEANTSPGAAPNENPPGCMRDEDGDDWGDDLPPPGVDPGTDCDDTDPDAFPGAAPNETPPNLCTVDSDGDGWGDANPGGGGGGGTGPQGGSDCYDGNAGLNPDTLQLTAIMPFNGGPADVRELQLVDTTTAARTPFVTLQTAMGGIPNVNLVTGTLSEAGEIITNDLYSAQLYSIDYEASCALGTGVVEPLGMAPYGDPAVDLVCGLEFTGDGSLYGIDNNDTLVTFDPATWTDTGAIPITLDGGPLNISSCGMAYDCSQDRLLVANGIDWSIYSIDPATGEATLLRDLDPFFGPAWNPVGLAWDPVSRTVYLSTGGNLYNVDIDDAAAVPVNLGAFGPQPVSNLQYLPECAP